MILACNRERIEQAVKALIPPRRSAAIPPGRRASGVAAALVIMGFVLAFDQVLVNLLGHGKG
jgi:hypothetical protein